MKFSITILTLIICVVACNFALGATINVPADHTTIQAAIDAAVDGDTVLVADGTYEENIDFKKKSLVLSSLFQQNNDAQIISSTVIDGGDWDTTVVMNGKDSKLIGFSITKGVIGIKITGENNEVSNCKIYDNNHPGDSAGGGVVTGQDSLIKDCEIYKNYARHGGGIRVGGTSIVDGCKIYNNTNGDGNGSQLACWGGEPVISNSIISESVRMHPNSKNVIEFRSKTSPIMSNLLIVSDNSTGEEIFYSWEESNPRLFHITVINIGKEPGNLVRLRTPSHFNITNSLVYGYNLTEGRGITATYSRFDNPTSGLGNLNDKPNFVDFSDGNYRLSDSSPCIGGGKQNADVPQTDIDGNPRPNPLDSQPDMGAYESDLAVITVRQKPVLSIEDKEINFGSVEIGNSTFEEIFLTNVGDADLTITSVISDLKDFTTSFPLDEPLAPGQSQKLSVTFYPRSEGEISETISINSNAGSKTINVKGTGVITSAQKSYKASLSKGLNMISLPLQPETPMSAKSLSTELSATVLIKLDKQTKDFVSYVPEVFDSFNFTLEGAEGYIVNVMKDQDITFNGTAWDNTAAAPSNLDQLSSTTWAFTVVIDNPQLTNQVGVIRNLRTGQTISTSTLSSTDLSSLQRQAVSLVDQSRQPVVEAGDLIEVNVGSSRWRYQLNQSELERAYVYLDLSQMNSLPNQTQLLQNYPNPFNPETWIPFDLAEDTEVAVTIYDVEGQTIRTLDLGWVMAGRHHNRSQSIYWDGRTEMGETVASGVYFYQISAADYSQTRRMVILK